MQKFSLEEINTIIAKHKFLVFDKKVHELYFKNNDFKGKTVFLLDGPESKKNLAGFEELTSFLLSRSIKRDDCILAIGGGATTDLVGFVASCILRGVRWSAIPTTLLAMIDASIGGKTGINSKYGKNLIGSFHLPQDIFINSAFLESLDEAQIMSGKGELLKYCFLNREIEQFVFEHGFCHELIELCVSYKSSVVDQDLLESGIRAVLNFGHTFAHAIEKVSELPHGLAVAIGVKWNLLLFDQTLLEKFNRLIEKLEIIIPSIKNIDKEQFFELLLRDKKNSGKQNDDIVFIVNSSKMYIPKDKLTGLIENQNEINSVFK